jgi:hypothetical protein
MIDILGEKVNPVRYHAMYVFVLKDIFLSYTLSLYICKEYPHRVKQNFHQSPGIPSHCGSGTASPND